MRSVFQAITPLSFHSQCHLSAEFVTAAVLAVWQLSYCVLQILVILHLLVSYSPMTLFAVMKPHVYPVVIVVEHFFPISMMQKQALFYWMIAIYWSSYHQRKRHLLHFAVFHYSI